MAWSSAALTAQQQANYAADRPILLGENLLRSATSIKWTADGNLASADISAAGTSTSYIHDGYTKLLSAPNADAAAHYLCIDLGAEYAFDTAVLFGTELCDSVVMAIADNAAFSTNLTTIKTTTTTGFQRRSKLVLNAAAGTTPYKFTARYVRFSFASSPNDTPYISEIFIGERRQLAAHPLVPFDTDSMRSSVNDLTTSDGETTRYTYYRGQRTISANLQTAADPYRADLLNFYRYDITHGTKPFVYIEQPTTYPHVAYLMMMDSPELAYPWDGPCGRTMSLQASEQGPYFYELEI